VFEKSNQLNKSSFNELNSRISKFYGLNWVKVLKKD